jgi:hypothetical protein
MWTDVSEQEILDNFPHTFFEQCLLAEKKKNVAVFWGIAPCSPYMKRRFGGRYHIHLHGRKSAEQEILDNFPYTFFEQCLLAEKKMLPSFWGIAPCSPPVNRRFGGTYHLHLQSKMSADQETSVQRVARHLSALYPGRWQHPYLPLWEHQVL